MSLTTVLIVWPGKFTAMPSGSGKLWKKGSYISDVFLGYRNIPHFIIAVSRKIDGRKVVIRATIDTVAFCDLVRNVRIGKTGEAYILNRMGVLQTQRRSGGSLMEKDPESVVPLKPHSGIRTFIQTGMTGQNYLYATTLDDGPEMAVGRQAGEGRSFQSAPECWFSRLPGGSRRWRGHYCHSRIFGRADCSAD